MARSTFLRWLQFSSCCSDGGGPLLTWNLQRVTLLNQSVRAELVFSLSQQTLSSASPPSAPAAEPRSLTLLPAGQPHSNLALSQLQHQTNSVNNHSWEQERCQRPTILKTGDVFNPAVYFSCLFSLSLLYFLKCGLDCQPGNILWYEVYQQRHWHYLLMYQLQYNLGSC